MAHVTPTWSLEVVGSSHDEEMSSLSSRYLKLVLDEVGFLDKS